MLSHGPLPSIASGRQSIRMQSGATLLEALITVVVIGFGLLGVAGLLVKGVTANTFSNYRSIAISKAYEITDRIRSNGAAWTDLVTGHIAIPVSEPGKKCETTTSGTTNSAAPANPGDYCSHTEQAQWDLWVWSKSVQDTLPGGTATFSPVNAWSNATNSFAFEVTVAWSEKATAPGITDPDPKSFVLRFEP